MSYRRNWLVAQHKILSALFAVLVVVYILQAIFVKPNPATLHKYHVTASSLHVLSLALAIPYILIWWVGFRGVLHLIAYHRSIKGSKDGEAFRTISLGVLILVLWLPVSTIISSVATNHYASHPSSTRALTIIVNYINLVILVPAFWALYKGSQQLLSLVKTQQPSARSNLWTTLLFISYATLYTLLVLHDPARRVPTHNLQVASYYESDLLIVLTLVLPRLLMWYVGIQAALNLYTYSQKVRGRLYKYGLRQLAAGIGGVIIFIIILRSIQSLTSELSHWGLGLVVALVYGLFILIGVCYALIAKGAAKLQHLEEV